MEALILAMIIAYAVKKAAGDAHDHWQGSKAANRKASNGKPVGWRARSAARHDSGYWAEQVRGGFPQVRHGLYMGWHSGRLAQLEGREARAQAKAEHAQARARVTGAVREQRRRQAEVLGRIRATAAASRRRAAWTASRKRTLTGGSSTCASPAYAGPIDQDGYTRGPGGPGAAERSWRNLGYLDQSRKGGDTNGRKHHVR